MKSIKKRIKALKKLSELGLNNISDELLENINHLNDDIVKDLAEKKLQDHLSDLSPKDRTSTIEEYISTVSTLITNIYSKEVASSYIYSLYIGNTLSLVNITAQKKLHLRKKELAQ